MIPLLQPPHSRLCGQACIAMVAECSIEEAAKALGHSHATRTGDLVQAFGKLRIGTADRLTRISRLRPSYPARAILRIGIDRTGRSRRTHWLLNWDGVIYDPEGSWPSGYDGWTITSYLTIF